MITRNTAPAKVIRLIVLCKKSLVALPGLIAWALIAWARIPNVLLAWALIAWALIAWAVIA